jgi:hypothetical protein
MEKLKKYKSQLNETKKWDRRTIGFVKSSNIYGHDIVVIPNFGNIVKGRNFLRGLGFEQAGNPKYMIYKRNSSNEIIMNYNSITGNWHTDNKIEDFEKVGFEVMEQ